MRDAVFVLLVTVGLIIAAEGVYQGFRLQRDIGRWLRLAKEVAAGKKLGGHDDADPQ